MLGRQLPSFACSSSFLWMLACSFCLCPSSCSWFCLSPGLWWLAPLCFSACGFAHSPALPSPPLRCADPASCGGAAPFRGVLRVPQLCSASSAGLVRSVWLPRHLCPLSRPEWLVFCATCCGQRVWARYMSHETWH